MEFYKHDQLFLLLCYCISRSDRQESIVISHLKSTAYRNKISFKVVRISDSKHEKVCAVCPYLLFILNLWRDVRRVTVKPSFIYLPT